MSAGFQRENIKNGEENAPASLTESSSPDDESLREENSLSACLLRILQTGKPASNDSQGCDIDENTYKLPEPNSFNNRREVDYNQVDCRRLYLPHCQTSTSKSNCSTSLGMSSKEEELAGSNEDSGDRLEKWRAAGEALRKVLVETGAVSTKPEKRRGKPGCLKRGLRKKKDGEGSGGDGSPTSDDPMNMMLEEYHSKEDPEPSQTNAILAPVENAIKNSEKSGVKASKKSGGVISNVRERVQQITSRFSHMKSSPSSESGVKKGHSHKYNRTTGPLQTRSSSIGHGSSSESDGEGEVKKHPGFVPRCRRVSSSSKSSKTTNDSSPKKCQNCSSNTNDAKDLCQKCEEKLDLEQENQDRLSDLDNQEDMVTQKLKKLAQDHNDCPSLVSDSDDTSLAGYRNFGRPTSGRLMSAETDSIVNLADVESSLHSTDNETLEESDINDRRYGFHYGKKEVKEEENKYHGWESDGEENWSEKGGTLKRNKERPDNLDDCGDLPDLVSSSDGEHGGKKNGDVPGLVSDSSEVSASDGDADEADDEFECDCSVCQQQKTRQANSGDGWLTEEEEQILGALDNDRIEFLTESAHLPPFISPAELTPLDLLLMREGRRELLELMFQNVIMQMLTVYPDLLSEQAPPPAEAATINDLPKVKVDASHLSEDFKCPICLCKFELGEEIRELPCRHSFHTLCIQAWLCKSGTCPVCRCVISSAS